MILSFLYTSSQVRNTQQMSKSRCAPQLRYENRTCEVKAADAFLKRTCDRHFADAILITQLRDFKTHLRSPLRRCDFHNAGGISKRICDLHFAGAILITQVGFRDASATFISQVGLSYRRCDFKTIMCYQIDIYIYIIYIIINKKRCQIAVRKTICNLM